MSKEADDAAARMAGQDLERMVLSLTAVQNDLRILRAVGAAAVAARNSFYSCAPKLSQRKRRLSADMLELAGALRDAGLTH